jgi:hypothetical protein
MKYIIIIIIGLLTSTFIFSQKDSTKLDIKQVEVIKSFEATLEEANFIPVAPIMLVAPAFNPKYEYDISIVPLELQYPDPQIKPLAMNPDEPFIVKKGYLYAGYGFRKNLDVKLGYHVIKKDRYDAGIHLGYESLDNSSNVPFQKYRDADAALYGNYLLKENLKLYGHINTQFLSRNLYHTDLGVDTLYSDAESNRSINGLKITAGFANPEPTRFNINYDVRVTLRNMSITQQDARDNGFGLMVMANKSFGKSTVLEVQAGYDYSAFNSTKDVSLSTAFVTPTFKTKIKNLTFDLGLDVLYSSDENSALFPEVMISYGLLGQKIQVFGEVLQDYHTNNFTQVSPRNPFLNTQMDSITNSVWRQYAAGLKGKFSFLTYQVKGGYKDVNNQMFLLNNNTDRRLFDMVYDDMSVIFISGNVDFVFSDRYTFGGWLTQNIYNPSTLAHAWHLPNLEANAYATAGFLDKRLILRADLFFGNGVHFINKNDVINQSNVLFDLNVEANYAITSHFRIFAKGINLLDNQFERYYGYPSIGINGMAGIKWVF